MLSFFPEISQIKKEILEHLQQLGGQATRQEMLTYFKTKWQLTTQELELRDPAGGIQWEKRIDRAVQELTETDEITHPRRGLWQLTTKVGESTSTK